jgi:hypothetical protein
MFGKKDETAPENVNIYPPVEGETVFQFKKNIVRVDKHFVRITRGGTLSNLILQGLDGEKSIRLSTITGLQIKEPGLTVGYIQFVYPGSTDIKGGVTQAVSDENTVTFDKKEKPQVLELRELVEKAIIDEDRRN